MRYLFFENENEVGKKAVFLDRDGTINVDKGYVYQIEDFVYLDGAIEALQLFHKMGFLIVIITNQSGVARGYYKESDVNNLHEWLVEDLAKNGVPVAGIYYCPHHPEAKIMRYRKNCQCRKPGTALFKQAAKELQIEMKGSFAIGDRVRDLEICKEYDIQGILLEREIEESKNPVSEKIWRCRNWKEIMEKIKTVSK